MNLRTAAVGLVLAAAAAFAPAGAAGTSGGLDAPACAAVTSKLPGNGGSTHGVQRYNLVYRFRCNFNVTRLSVRTSKRLVRVQRAPALDAPEPGDSLSCARSSPRLVACSGDVGQGVRIRGRLKVKGGACGAEPVSMRFRAEGGPDCDAGTPCPAIGFFKVKTVERPSGC
jgi:hypothetical protein